MKESLHLSRIEEIASSYGVSPEAVYYWLNHKVKPALGEILKNDPPGPERKPETGVEQEVKGTTAIEERPKACEKCGAMHIWKNGTYGIINWIWLLTIGWLVGIQKASIQRWRCANCGHEMVSAERQRQKEARDAWWQQVKRMIGLSRFKLNLTVRKTQILVSLPDKVRIGV